MTPWHREPLVHFLVLGASLFLLYGAVAEQQREEAVIEITAGDIEQAVRIFEKTFQRSPTEVELKGLIEDRIREEVLYREALAMGLDRGDTVVRRRLRQKVEFLFNDIAGLAEPTVEELEAYLEEHADEFRRSSRVSFRHIFVDRDRRGAAASAEVERLLAFLADERQVDVDALGDHFVLPSSFELVREREVSKNFGSAFLARFEKVAVGPWVGPVESGFGLHLVQVLERVEGEVPELAAIRREVVRNLSAERRAESAVAFYQGLRQRYTVHVARHELVQEFDAVAR